MKINWKYVIGGAIVGGLITWTLMRPISQVELRFIGLIFNPLYLAFPPSIILIGAGLGYLIGRKK